MKKYIILTAIVATTLVITIQTVVAAPNGDNKGKMSPAPTLLNKVRDEVQMRKENANTNQEMRINKLENRLAGSSTNRFATSSARFGSTTPPFRGPGYMGTTSTSSMMRYADNAKQKMFENIFKIQKKNIQRQLVAALNNLKHVRDRVDSRIEKAESSGRDMTKAKSLLVIADAKITAAENAINTFNDLTATSSTATSSASSTIDLQKPRAMANEAKKAIKTAQKALNDVVVAIAHAMGFKIGFDGHIINPTPATTTATSTATTTTATTTASSTTQ